LINSELSILFRADANNEIGFGHLIRSIALAKILLVKFTPFFAIKENANAALFLQKENLPFVEIPNSVENDIDHIQNIIKFQPKIVVLDGYFFDTNYQQRWKNSGAKLICIDDIHAYHFVADAVINHGGVPNINSYSTEPYTQLFVGFKYALLRNAFFKPVPQNLKIRKNKVFVFMGGSAIPNITGKILSVLASIPSIEGIEFLKGASEIFEKEVIPLLEQNNKIKFHENLNDTQIVDILDTCKFAITPASSSSIEVCARQIPLITGKTVDNQNNIYTNLTTNVMCMGLENMLEVESEVLKNNILNLLNNSFLQLEMIENQKKRMLNVEQNLIDIFEKYKL